MPPKAKITKEDILLAAVEIVRRSGADALGARAVAAALQCSTHPVFSNFESMEALRFAVLEKADAMCEEYMRLERERGEFPPFKASGMAYIRFAEEEKELFKFLYMRDRTGETIPAETEQTNLIQSIIKKSTGLSQADAKLFHLEMWAYVHGIAVMFATDFFDIDRTLVSRMLTDAYQGLCKQYGVGG